MTYVPDMAGSHRGSDHGQIYLRCIYHRRSKCWYQANQIHMYHGTIHTCIYIPNQTSIPCRLEIDWSDCNCTDINLSSCPTQTHTKCIATDPNKYQLLFWPNQLGGTGPIQFCIYGILCMVFVLIIMGSYAFLATNLVEPPVYPK